MSSAADSDISFYAGLPRVESFASLADASLYRPVPDGWTIAVADIVGSTAAIAAGRYKVVNTAAAAAVAAVSNALAHRDIPFVFGGDGAAFAAGPADADTVCRALRRVAAWIGANLDLDLRVAAMPVAEIRRHGRDLRVARFAVSPELSYAMFAGGGLDWAERQMKAGAFALEPDGSEPPDLSGLSCRFSEIRAKRGVILSLIVVPPPAGPSPAYGAAIDALLDLVEPGATVAHPLPEGGPPLEWSPEGRALETRMSTARPGRPRAGRALRTGIHTLLSRTLFRAGRGVGGFDPRRYLSDLVRNTDFRKFGDGLRMTVDCTPEQADRIEALLEEAELGGAVLFGVHRQTSALLTCFVPSPTRRDHVHFVDGAAGGYAMAARRIKAGPFAPP